MKRPEETVFWNPYAAGLLLGLVLLASFVLMGWGLGSSAAATRVAFAGLDAVAPGVAESSSYISGYLNTGDSILMDWMVFEVLGVLLGGIVGAYSAGRINGVRVDRGEGVSVGARFASAFVGGGIMGFAARLARGCTSGQALTGGAALAAGSWVFMFAVFAGGYLMAPFVRRLWR